MQSIPLLVFQLNNVCLYVCVCVNGIMIRCRETHFAFAFPLLFSLVTHVCLIPSFRHFNNRIPYYERFRVAVVAAFFVPVCVFVWVSFWILFLIPLHHAHPSPPLPATNEFIYIVTSRFIYFKKRFVLLLCICWCCCCCCFVIPQCDFSLIPFSKFSIFVLYLTILFISFICFIYHRCDFVCLGICCKRSELSLISANCTLYFECVLL